MTGPQPAAPQARQFRRFLDLIDEQVADERPVHVVLDNVATHRTAEIQRWFQRHPRFSFQFPSTYSSWMNRSSAGSRN